MNFFLSLFTIVGFVSAATAQVTCGDDYLCTEDPNQDDLVWVMRKGGNVNGPTCSSVCSAVDSLCTTTAELYNCEDSTTTFHSIDSFAAISEGLGFTCQAGGCWDGVSTDGQIWISKDEVSEGVRRCYFPSEGSDGFRCGTHPGNANCFGERYALVCPCTKRTPETMCSYESPPNDQSVSRWPDDLETGTSCLARINYWRKVACDEGWVECPPCGLPPVAECVGCHACTNSQAQFDSENGAHSSFTRCGENVQGVGGGATCANVIDSFVSERTADDEGVVRCQGHCGPIVKAGCWSYQWGKAETSNTYVLNWRGCNADACDSYCEDPSRNECFLNEGEEPFPGVGPGGGGSKDSSDDGGDGGDGGDGDDASTISFAVFLFAASFILSTIC